jgi:enoyl-CoA hydratase/carnithine racemase
MASSAGLSLERDGPVAWCRLERPPLNLLEPGLIAAIHETFSALSAEASVRAVVLSGSGRAFTAGMDVRVLAGLDAAGARELITALHGAIQAVHHATFPVIAAVHGPCLGAGLELALACDLRIASTEATFGLPEVRVGVPSVIEAALLPPLIGLGRAAELLLTGEAVPAERALAWGLVNRVTDGARLRAATEDMLARILAGGPAAIRLQKELMVRWRYSDLATAIRLGIHAFASAYATGEPAEGAAAFLAKRPPKFEGAS